MMHHEAIAYIHVAGKAELDDLAGAIKKALKKFPKQAKEPKQKRPLSPDAQVRHDAFVMFKDWFLRPKEKDGAGFTDFYFDGAQSGGLSMWIKKMEYRYRVRNEGQWPTAHKLVVNMRLMFTNLPPYWTDKVDFPTINGKFEVILQQISKSILAQQHEQQSDPLQQARELANERRSAGRR